MRPEFNPQTPLPRIHLYSGAEISTNNTGCKKLSEVSVPNYGPKSRTRNWSQSNPWPLNREWYSINWAQHPVGRTPIDKRSIVTWYTPLCLVYIKIRYRHVASRGNVGSYPLICRRQVGHILTLVCPCRLCRIHYLEFPRIVSFMIMGGRPKLPAFSKFVFMWPIRRRSATVWKFKSAANLTSRNSWQVFQIAQKVLELARFTPSKTISDI